MRPPACAICGESEGCTLVSFQETDKDREDRRRSAEEGWVGHPGCVEWFCGQHEAAARALSDRTRTEAMRELREKP